VLFVLWVGDIGVFCGEDGYVGGVARIGRGGIDQVGQIAVGRVGILTSRCIVCEQDAGGPVVAPKAVQPQSLAIARQRAGFTIALRGVFITIERRHYEVGGIV